MRAEIHFLIKYVEFMRSYEVTFIVDPVLSGDEIKSTAQTYVEHLKSEGCEIVHVEDMGLGQLAYPINKRSSGVYFCIEFQCDSGSLIARLELALRRDERIMRFLTASLDKFGVKYNADKRAGLIGKSRKDRVKSDEPVPTARPAAAPAEAVAAPKIAVAPEVPAAIAPIVQEIEAEMPELFEEE